MTRSTVPTQSEILQVLSDAVRPLQRGLEDEFACMYWAQELEKAADELKRSAGCLFDENLYLLYENGLTSSRYQVQFPVQAFHTVNYDALARDLPAVYEKLVYVAAADALRILGRKRLYSLCMQKDMARTKRCEVVALEDLRKVLKEEEIGPFLLRHEKPLKPVIVPLGEVSL